MGCARWLSIYTIRAANGRGLRRLTVNPYPPRGDFGGGDIPGDFSPDGTRFVFMRAKPGAGPVPRPQPDRRPVRGDHQRHGPAAAHPYGLANSHDNGLADWSRDGRKILFASAHGPCSPSGRMAPACEQSLSRLLVASPMTSPRVSRHTVRGAALGLARHAW